MKILTTSVAFSLPLALHSLTAQVYTQVDLSSYLNYDGVITQNEINYASANHASGSNYRVGQIIGENNMKNGQAYTDDGSAGAGDALPSDGIIGGGKYQISTAFDNGTDYSAPSSNLVRIVGDSSTPSETLTMVLDGSEQGQYSGINFAFVTYNGGSSTSYRSTISVTYTDATTDVILLTQGTSVGGLGGGLFGADNFANATDSTSFTNEAPGTGETVTLNNLITTIDYAGITGSSSANSQRSLIRSGPTSIWEFSEDLALDSSKVLESISITIKSGGTNRASYMNVFGTTLVAVPEPSAYASILGLVGLTLALSRRSRRP
ncbi:MAG: hypothetical protein ACQKBT_07805 [Puniceicoccales bacterium]